MRALVAVITMLSVQILSACTGIAYTVHGYSLPTSPVFAPIVDLLYLSDGGEYVYMFSFPGGSPEGYLKGIYGPSGMCTDSGNNVFVTENSGGAILEYAHGGTQPIATLNDSNARPLGCAFDPMSRNLAVTSYAGHNVGEAGSIQIWKNESGSPTTFVDADFLFYFFCTYDNNGNLFIDGQDKYLRPLVAELPSVATSFQTMKVTGFPKRFRYPSGILWDGRYLVVGDYDRSRLYRLKVSGNSATLVDTVSLYEGSGVEQFTIASSGGHRILVGPNNLGTSAMYWPYPGGGLPTQMIRSGGVGAVVSKGTIPQ
ncbi:MAG: WD40 repeat domain-containing protein [Candidatus Eremiobacteraeota bacterium]|nr:WD40 repeat domain-containing protein [Candidatus Eremiobacteraeota bacterium]